MFRFFFLLIFRTEREKQKFLFIQHIIDEKETEKKRFFLKFIFYQDDPVKYGGVGRGFNINRPSESHDIL